MEIARSNEFTNADGLLYSGPDGVLYGPSEKPSGPLPGLGGAGYTPPKASKQKGNVGEKIDKGFDLAEKGIGVLKALKGLVSKPKPGAKAPKETAPPPPPEKKGMSTGTIVGVSAAVLALIGIIYVATKKK